VRAKIALIIFRTSCFNSQISSDWTWTEQSKYAWHVKRAHARQKLDLDTSYEGCIHVDSLLSHRYWYRNSNRVSCVPKNILYLQYESYV